ncbi:hypothetical protein [Anaerosacchariphilus polymeriproducens]|uniref:Uncharacterized protein n=1 Tax=Anaerosacchariphilus polymeriproducens TaxID=1812858 RepID=A0A371AW98_9FIRM|nr:hypothetical protein [Anaerosacchariphilus polymeriproducens]RDU23855.1 hypothetical protein DWV06_08330 [Anaerosacchariphilus polymeriproducens]
MFEKVNPYLKDELSKEAVAHKCGCRCVSESKTVGNAINLGISINGCYVTCRGTANRNANYSAAKNDKKY